MCTGTIVTFYSYKGGGGRTFALANVATLLSLWGYRVLCIDWDLEAPGLHMYFKPWLQREGDRGLIEMIQAYADGREPDWHEFVTRVNFSGAKEPLLFMKAGLQDASYIGRTQALDWEALYNNHNLGNILERLRSDWKQELDFVLIDSRTGVTDIGNICTVQLPDTLLILLTANDQSLEGSLSVLERIQAARANFVFDRARLLVVPIVSRFERRVEYVLADEWLAKFAKALAPLYQDWIHKDITAADLLNYIRIPYIPFWSFGEKLPVIEKGTNDPEDIGYPLETLAALVAQRFVFSDILIRNRDSFVSAVKKKPPTNNNILEQEQSSLKKDGPINLFLSYSVFDEDFAQELQTHLAPLRRRRLIGMWSASSIPAGASLHQEVNLRLKEAEIILLFISPDYLSSTTSDAEIAQAMARHNAGEAVTIPILLRPTDWETLSISKLDNTLPSNGLPVVEWSNRDAAWVDVVSGIRKAINEFMKRK